MTLEINIAFGGINHINIGGLDLVPTEETTRDLLGLTHPTFVPLRAKMGSGDKVTPTKSLREL